MAAPDINEVMEALRALIEAHPSTSYLTDSGYVGRNPAELVQLNKFPFFNLFPVRSNTSAIERMNFSDRRRVLYEIEINYAQQSLEVDKALKGDGTFKGVLQIAADLKTAILSDTTLGGVVQGLPKGTENITNEYLVFTDEQGRYIVGADMGISFFQDESS